MDVADDLQLPRVYPRVGKIPEGRGGGAAADGEGSTCALAQGDQSTMQANAALAASHPAPTTVPNTERALRLFWYHGQHQTLESAALSSAQALAEVVVAAVVEELC